MELVKTIKVKIYKPTHVKEQFLELLRQNAKALNYYADALEENPKLNKTGLHRMTYHEVKKQVSLQTGIIQTARDKAYESFKSFQSRRRKGRVKKDKIKFSENTPVRLDARSYTIIETGNTFKYFASIATNGNGRVRVPLLGKNYQYKYLKKAMKGKLKTGTAELTKIKDDWYLYITIKKEVTVPTPNPSFTPTSVDIGLVNLAVSVTLPNDRIAAISFQSGRRANHKRELFRKVRQSLGKAKKLLIRSASVVDALHCHLEDCLAIRQVWAVNQAGDSLGAL